MAYTIFLSHSSKDAHWVKRIADDSKQVGVEVYMYEHDPQPGRMIAEKVESAIRASDALVVLLTRESQFSAYVQQEIGLARGLGKPVIPLVQPGVSHANLAMLEGAEYINFDFEDPQPGLSSFLEYLRRTQFDKQASQALFAAGALVETASHSTLSRWETEILLNVPEDGRIMRLEFQLGESLLVGPMALPDVNNYDADSAAHYLDALDLLIRRGLVRFVGGDLYMLTGRGFDLRRTMLGHGSAS